MNASHVSPNSSSLPPEAGVPPRLMRGILALRQQLPKARDFAKLYECFDDRIARAPELWDSSQLRDNQILASIAVAVAGRFRPGFAPKACMLYTVGDTGFWHGAAIGTNALACLFYDERVGLGIVALSNPFDGTGRTDFVRFTQVSLGPPSPAHDPSERLPC